MKEISNLQGAEEEQNGLGNKSEFVCTHWGKLVDFTNHIFLWILHQTPYAQP